MIVNVCCLIFVARSHQSCVSNTLGPGRLSLVDSFLVAVRCAFDRLKKLLPLGLGLVTAKRHSLVELSIMDLLEMFKGPNKTWFLGQIRCIFLVLISDGTQARLA